MKEKNEISITASRKRAALINLITNYSSIGLLIVQGILLVPIYLRYIDPRIYGAWLATGSVVGYLGLLDFGFNSIIVQKVAYVAGQKDRERLGKLIGTGLWIIVSLSLLPLLLGCAAYQYVPGWVNIEGPGALQISRSFLVASLATSLMVVTYGVGGIVVGLQWLGVVSVQFIITSILGILMTLLFLYMDLGVMAIALGLLFRSVVLSIGHSIYLWWWIKKRLPSTDISFEPALFRDLFRGSLLVFASKISNTLSKKSDNLIVAAMIDPRLTVVLALTKKSAEMITAMAVRIASSLMPSMAHLSGETDRGKLVNYMLIMTKVCLIVGVFGTGGFFLLNGQFVKLWVGEEFYGGTVLTILISISSLIIILNTALYTNLFAKGKIAITTKATILEAVVRIPLSIAMCYYWGLQGIILAGIISIIPTSLLIQARSFKSVLKLQWSQIICSLILFLCKFSVPFIAGLILQTFWHPVDWVGFVMYTIVYSTLAISYYVAIDKDVRRFAHVLIRLPRNRWLGK